MPSEKGPQRPKYRVIADALKAAIESGEYEPGNRLPGESALAEQYGVAALTARQALKVLRNEGLVETKKGAGARVLSFLPIRRHGIERLARARWASGNSIWSTDEAGNRDVTVEARVGTVTAPAYVSQALALEPEARVCARSRRYIVDGRPVMLATSYLSLDMVEGSAITQVDTGEGGIYARLKELGHEPAHFREEIRCRLPVTDEAARLGMPIERPVIKICRTAFDASERAVEVNEMTLDSAAYVLEYAFDA
ncbi:GntR family transcriptional regulator [Streptomyces sp. NPDC056347]|uniref:GntR family transcriptional regulator n=1 Tax=Streptomyces sp. NPDC056347 TaxID=3345790 RepID=UPI0035DF6277